MTELDKPKMTHNEMIDTLKGLVFGTFDRTTAREREALDEAIKALEQEPCDGVVLIPKNATNGDMIKAMFPNAKASVFVKGVGVKGLDTYSVFTKKWWNSPYEGGKE
jgi:hypothetical protein